MPIYLLLTLASLLFTTVRTLLMTFSVSTEALATVSLGYGVIGLFGVLVAIPLNTSFIAVYKQSSTQEQSGFKKVTDCFLAITSVCSVAYVASIFSLSERFFVAEVFYVLAALFFVIGLLYQAILVSSDKSQLNLVNTNVGLVASIAMIFLMIKVDVAEPMRGAIILLLVTCFYPLVLFCSLVLQKRAESKTHASFSFDIFFTAVKKARYLFGSGLFAEIVRFIFRIVLAKTSELLLVAYQVALWLTQPFQSVVQYLINFRLYPKLIDNTRLVEKNVTRYFLVVLSAFICGWVFYPILELFSWFFDLIGKTELEAAREFFYFFLFAEVMKIIITVAAIFLMAKERFNIASQCELIMSLVLLLLAGYYYFADFSGSYSLLFLPPAAYLAFFIVRFFQIAQPANGDKELI